MQVIPTKLADCFIIQPNVFADDRGYFLETFNQQAFATAVGKAYTFVQDNESKSNAGVVRGLHLQTGDYAQAKYVSVVQGKVLDVVVDVRVGSPTFLQHIAVELSGENKTRLLVPRGFAHGFSVLENNTIFSYKCDNFYHKASEAGIAWNCDLLNIDWQINKADALVSDKDAVLPNSALFCKQVYGISI
jgi:dTDP-4-dehydrorhamnose 3,5-epimerase